MRNKPEKAGPVLGSEGRKEALHPPGGKVTSFSCMGNGTLVPPEMEGEACSTEQPALVSLQVTKTECEEVLPCPLTGQESVAQTGSHPTSITDEGTAGVLRQDRISLSLQTGKSCHKPSVGDTGASELCEMKTQVKPSVVRSQVDCELN